MKRASKASKGDIYAARPPNPLNLQSNYDGTHLSVDVQARNNEFLAAKAMQDPTGDGLKDFSSVKSPNPAEPSRKIA